MSLLWRLSSDTFPPPLHHSYYHLGNPILQSQPSRFPSSIHLHKLLKNPSKPAQLTFIRKVYARKVKQMKNCHREQGRGSKEALRIPMRRGRLPRIPKREKKAEAIAIQAAEEYFGQMMERFKLTISLSLL